MTKQTIEIDVPEGYEIVGYRVPTEGEDFLCPRGTSAVLTAGSGILRQHMVVRKTPKWRPAKPSDLDNGPAPARFTNVLMNKAGRVYGNLVGVYVERNTPAQFCASYKPDDMWFFCEVME
jgi:hypothetical protein